MIRWFTSKAVREAGAMRKHVQRLLNAQCDLMKPEAVAAVEAKIDDLNTAIAENANTGKIRIKTEELQFAAEKWIKQYPNPVWRENIEVLLVAIAVAMGIRTFFLQPFKIPTGSMQPTLFGVTSVPDFSKARSEADAIEQAKLRDDMVIPTGFERVKKWFHGTSYIDLKANTDGTLDRVDPPVTVKLLNLWQTVWIGGKAHTIWFPPDLGEPVRRDGRLIDPLEYRAGLTIGRSYHRGDQVVKLEGHAGDHLFVDRLTYNFRNPERGEVVVFETAGIPAERRGAWGIPSDQFYIKRLVGLGGETIQIGDDRHLVINGRRLDASTPHFENVYSFDPKLPPRESHWSGHLNGADKPFFPDGTVSYEIPADHVMVMGDNTMNSLDSRYWGDFPQSSIMGRSFFVYWPITERFGLGNH